MFATRTDYVIDAWVGHVTLINEQRQRRWQMPLYSTTVAGTSPRVICPRAFVFRVFKWGVWFVEYKCVVRQRSVFRVYDF
jgi:hypothetical protein